VLVVAYFFNFLLSITTRLMLFAVDNEMNDLQFICGIAAQNCAATDVKQIHVDATDSSAAGDNCDSDVPHTPVSFSNVFRK